MFAEAIADYDKAISLKSEAQTHNSRARLYFDSAGEDVDKLKKALSDYNKAIELKPNDGEFWINRGATYARLGDLNTALEHINTGLKLKPDHATGYLNRFVISLNLADLTPDAVAKNSYYEKALADIIEYQKFKPMEANTYYERARMNRLLGRYEEGLNQVAKAISMDSSAGLYYYEKAILYLSLKNITAAKTEIENAKKLGYNKIDPSVQAQINQ
jgi:tetratricopeptide (TPR) repeat protein